VNRLAIAALSLALVAPGAARAESPRWGSFELGGGRYAPNIDAQSGFGSPGPYGEVFGTKRRWDFRLGVSWAIFTWPGALEAGFRTGFFRANGDSLQVSSGAITNQPSPADPTALNIVPTSLMLTYRFDLLADRLHIPLAPYVRASFERYNWWVTKTAGATAKYGATNGYSFTGGIAFLLDVVDSGLAREMDEDTGINHTYVYFDVTKSKVNDFGSKKSWDLSDRTYSYDFGLMFQF
jgi:hypothetical protein